MTNTIKIELPATIEVTNRDGMIATVPTADMTAESVIRCFVHGVEQYVNDAASGALAQACDLDLSDMDAEDAKAARKEWGKENPEAVQAERKHLREQKAADIAANDWTTQRATGGHVDPLDKYRAAIALEFFNTNKGDAASRAYHEIDAKDQTARMAYRLAWAKDDARADQVDAIATVEKENAERKVLGLGALA